MRRRHALGLLAGAGALSAHSAEAQSGPPPNIELLKPYQVPVGTSAGPLTATSRNVNGLRVLVLSDGHEVWFGTDDTVSATTGWPLSDRDWDYCWVRNANEIYVICPTSPSARVVVWPFVYR